MSGGKKEAVAKGGNKMLGIRGFVFGGYADGNLGGGTDGGVGGDGMYRDGNGRLAK